MGRLVQRVAPRLLDQQGISTLVASALLVTAGDNPDRLRSESSFAHLCSVAPLHASSGKQERHRLNRGGDRQANCALHTIAIVRMSHDERTKKYIARRPHHRRQDQTGSNPLPQALHPPAPRADRRHRTGP